MKKSRSARNALVCALFATAALFSVCVPAGAYSASAAELPVATLMEGMEYTLDVNAERGAAFDFTGLPATVAVKGYVPGRKPPATLDASVTWLITAETAAKAARSEDFTIPGTMESAAYQDTVYALPGGTDATANVRFIDRSATTGMTFQILPAYKYGTDKLIILEMLAFFNAPFDFTGVTGVELQYSFGDGWQSLSIPPDEWDALNGGANTQVNFTNADFAYDGDLFVFSETELKRFLTDLVHFRVKLTGGLFEGYTNTVTIEGERSKVNEGAETGGNDSGILPDRYGDGARGGAIAFWTSPGGTALAVVLGVVTAAACFGVGLFVGIRIYRRKRKDA